jgi:hypothetical protein
LRHWFAERFWKGLLPDKSDPNCAKNFSPKGKYATRAAGVPMQFFEIEHQSVCVNAEGWADSIVNVLGLDDDDCSAKHVVMKLD